MRTDAPTLTDAPGPVEGELLRPLGAFEQVFHLYNGVAPVLFAVAAHLSGDVDEEGLRRAAARLQQVHPLLAATVAHGTDAEGGTANGNQVEAAPADYRRANARVCVRAAPTGLTWQQVAARELVDPFAVGDEPLWRLVLLPAAQAADTRAPASGTAVADLGSPPSTTVLLVVDHRLLDGRAALRLLRDLSVLLAGGALDEQPLPPSQEEMLMRVADRVVDGAIERDRPVPVDPRLVEPGVLRPFDARPAHVDSVQLPPDRVAALRSAARAHGVSLHELLTAAVERAVLAAGRDPVRVVHPTDLRAAVGLDDDVALRILPGPPRTAAGGAGSRADDGPRDGSLPAEDLWGLASQARTVLRAARQPDAVLRSSAALQAQVPQDGQQAVAGMMAMSGMDVMLTNLGVIDHGPDVAGDDHSSSASAAHAAQVRLLALQAPAMSVHVAGEQVISAVTSAGWLRLTRTAHDPLPGLLDAVVAELSLAATGSADADDDAAR